MYRTIVLSFACLSLLTTCQQADKHATPSNTPDSVEVFALQMEPVAKILSLPAELHPWERAELYAKVEGYVKEVRSDIGDRVKRNQVLAILDAPEVTANYGSASADLQSARSRYHTSLDTYKRIVRASKEQGAVSESELERSQNQMLSDSAAFEAARSSANAYAQLREYLVIRAPFDGVITMRNVDPGTLVGTDRQPMLVLEDLTTLRLRLAIPETYSTTLPEDPSIDFTVDAQPGIVYHAKLARKANRIDPATRTELWEFEVDNAKQDLKSGMYANATLKLQRKEESFAVPYSSVVTTLEKKFVIRVSDNKTEWVDVRNGINMTDKVEIFGDLREGDQIVLKANDQMKAGSVVFIAK